MQTLYSSNLNENTILDSPPHHSTLLEKENSYYKDG